MSHVVTTKSVVFKDGTLDFGTRFSDDKKRSIHYIKFTSGHNEWVPYQGAWWESIVNLGRGWYLLSPYWAGDDGLPIEVPFKLNVASLASH